MFPVLKYEIDYAYAIELLAAAGAQIAGFFFNTFHWLLLDYLVVATLLHHHHCFPMSRGFRVPPSSVLPDLSFPGICSFCFTLANDSPSSQSYLYPVPPSYLTEAGLS